LSLFLKRYFFAILCYGYEIIRTLQLKFVQSICQQSGIWVDGGDAVLVENSWKTLSIKNGLYGQLLIRENGDKKTIKVLFENWLLNDHNTAFMFSLMPVALFGNVILIGRDPATGLEQDLNSIFSSITLMVEFYSKERTEYARKEANNSAASLR